MSSTAVASTENSSVDWSILKVLNRSQVNWSRVTAPNVQADIIARLARQKREREEQARVRQQQQQEQRQQQRASRPRGVINSDMPPDSSAHSHDPSPADPPEHHDPHEEYHEPRQEADAEYDESREQFEPQVEEEPHHDEDAGAEQEDDKLPQESEHHAENAQEPVAELPPVLEADAVPAEISDESTTVERASKRSKKKKRRPVAAEEEEEEEHQQQQEEEQAHQQHTEEEQPPEEEQPQAHESEQRKAREERRDDRRHNTEEAEYDESRDSVQEPRSLSKSKHHSSGTTRRDSDSDPHAHSSREPRQRSGEHTPRTEDNGSRRGSRQDPRDIYTQRDQRHTTTTTTPSPPAPNRQARHTRGGYEEPRHGTPRHFQFTPSMSNSGPPALRRSTPQYSLAYERNCGSRYTGERESHSTLDLFMDPMMQRIDWWSPAIPEYYSGGGATHHLHPAAHSAPSGHSAPFRNVPPSAVPLLHRSNGRGRVEDDEITLKAKKLMYDRLKTEAREANESIDADIEPTSDIEDMREELRRLQAFKEENIAIKNRKKGIVTLVRLSEMICRSLKLFHGRVPNVHTHISQYLETVTPEFRQICRRSPSGVSGALFSNPTMSIFWGMATCVFHALLSVSDTPPDKSDSSGPSAAAASAHTPSPTPSASAQSPPPSTVSASPFGAPGFGASPFPPNQPPFGGPTAAGAASTPFPGMPSSQFPWMQQPPMMSQPSMFGTGTGMAPGHFGAAPSPATYMPPFGFNLPPPPAAGHPPYSMPGSFTPPPIGTTTTTSFPAFSPPSQPTTAAAPPTPAPAQKPSPPPAPKTSATHHPAFMPPDGFFFPHSGAPQPAAFRVSVLHIPTPMPHRAAQQEPESPKIVLLSDDEECDDKKHDPPQSGSGTSASVAPGPSRASVHIPSPTVLEDPEEEEEVEYEEEEEYEEEVEEQQSANEQKRAEQPRPVPVREVADDQVSYTSECTNESASQRQLRAQYLAKRRQEREEQEKAEKQLNGLN